LNLDFFRFLVENNLFLPSDLLVFLKVLERKNDPIESAFDEQRKTNQKNFNESDKFLLLLWNTKNFEDF